MAESPDSAARNVHHALRAVLHSAIVGTPVDARRLDEVLVGAYGRELALRAQALTGRARQLQALIERPATP